MRFSQVAINAGTGSSTLSYQKGYFPILEVYPKYMALSISDSPSFLTVSIIGPRAKNNHAPEHKVSHWPTHTGSYFLTRHPSMIYTLIEQNYDKFQTTTRGCMTLMIEAQTWEDRSPGLPASRRNTLGGVIVFKTLSTILFQ